MPDANDRQYAGTIFQATHRVLESLRSIHRLDTAQAFTYRSQCVDSETRFRLWASNLGAYHAPDNPKSADFKLRHVPEVRQRINDILAEVQEGQGDIWLISSGGRSEQKTAFGDNDELEDDDDILDMPVGPQSELEELWLSIDDLIGSLMRLSVLIRQSVTRNRFDHATLAARKYRPLNPLFDINHVGHKYPKVERQSWIKIRLGEAITQRRQFLAYARDHHQRLSKEPTELQQSSTQELQEAPELQENTKSIPASNPTNDHTTASTLQPDKIDQTKLQELDEFGQAESSSQATSYVSTSTGDIQGSNLEVVHLETVAALDAPFQCPYCYGMVMFGSQSAWRRHVFHDLRPYVCTFESCTSGIFESRREWSNHELTVHRRCWTCPYCGTENFKTRADLEAHVASEHQSMGEPKSLSIDMIEAASKVIEYAQPAECPMCDDWDESLRRERFSRLGVPSREELTVPTEKFYLHVGKHMEQLALFAITPRLEDDDGSVNENQSIGNNASLKSGSNNVLEDKVGESHVTSRGNYGPGLYDAEPACAICGATGDNGECPHEGQRLEIALDQAAHRSEFLQNARNWVLAHARDHILHTFNQLKSARREAHLAHLHTLPCYTIYERFQGHPPLHTAQLDELTHQIKLAKAIFQTGIDADWQKCCLMYPKVLDYYYSLINIDLREDSQDSRRIIIPGDDDPRVKFPSIENATEVVPVEEFVRSLPKKESPIHSPIEPPIREPRYPFPVFKPESSVPLEQPDTSFYPSTNGPVWPHLAISNMEKTISGMTLVEESSTQLEILDPRETSHDDDKQAGAFTGYPPMPSPVMSSLKSPGMGSHFGPVPTWQPRPNPFEHIPMSHSQDTSYTTAPQLPVPESMHQEALSHPAPFGPFQGNMLLEPRLEGNLGSISEIDRAVGTVDDKIGSWHIYAESNDSDGRDDAAEEKETLTGSGPREELIYAGYPRRNDGERSSEEDTSDEDE